MAFVPDENELDDVLKSVDERKIDSIEFDTNNNQHSGQVLLYNGVSR